METHLADWLKGTADGIEAESILRKCVHCGFCTATCPTYQLLGDELDGPRGRIYLIKQVVEGHEPTTSTLEHLDRCLTCRNCESTCPSGVDYGHLVDVGRRIVESKVERPLAQKLVRTALREGLTRRWLFDPAMKLGKMARPLMPAALRAKVPVAAPAGSWPTTAHSRKVLLLNGCVQPAMMPAIDAATARVLDRVGVQAVVELRSGCCGAIRHHLNDAQGGLADVRRNIDAWWPHIEQGIEAIVVNASGCGAMLKDYAHLLRDDPVYAERASRITELAVDVAQFLQPFGQKLKVLVEAERVRRASNGARDRVVFHPPCTLQHGQRVRGTVESLLELFGAKVLPIQESHLCCGSAGTYSVLQPQLATQLRDRKLQSLQADTPDVILSANIGCLTHLQSGTERPVRHWIEWLDSAMGSPRVN